MSVDTYPYAEWTKWPEEDVREWVEEIAAAFSLNNFDTAQLLEEMLSRSGNWKDPPEEARFPIKMTEQLEQAHCAAYLALHSGRDENSNSLQLAIFEQNKRLNRPRQTPDFKPTVWERQRVVGSGLTQRVYWRPHREGLMLEEGKRAAAKARAFMARHPLRSEQSRMENDMREWLWRSGCVEISHMRWMVPESQQSERDGMWWYFERIGERLDMARRQIKEGEAERAAWHSLHAGRLFAEMEIKASHDAFFQKTLRTRDAQSDGGRSTRKGPQEARQAAWRKYREEGYASVMAGEMAGQELGVSETTIRRAFGGSYPEVDQ